MPASWPAASLYFGAIALFLAYAYSGQTAFLIAGVVAFAAQIVLRMKARPVDSCASPPEPPDQSRNAIN